MVGALAPLASGAGNLVGNAFSSIFGGGPPWSKSLAARKEVFARAAGGDPSAIEDVKNGALNCGSKFPEVCAFNRNAWEAIQLGQQGVRIIISAGGHPALNKMRAAANAAGLNVTAASGNIGNGILHNGNSDNQSSLLPAGALSAANLPLLALGGIALFVAYKAIGKR